MRGLVCWEGDCVAFRPRYLDMNNPVHLVVRRYVRGFQTRIRAYETC